MCRHYSSCPFCLSPGDKLIFTKSELFYAIYNKSPILPGHSLIVPIRHVTSFNELTIDELSEMMVFTRKVNIIISKIFNTPHFNWTLQDGVPAGQTVGHLHVHVIPRKKDDLPVPGDWYPKLVASTENSIDSDKRPAHSYEELVLIAKKLRNADSL